MKRFAAIEPNEQKRRTRSGSKSWGSNLVLRLRPKRWVSKPPPARGGEVLAGLETPLQIKKSPEPSSRIEGSRNARPTALRSKMGACCCAASFHQASPGDEYKIEAMSMCPGVRSACKSVVPIGLGSLLLCARARSEGARGLLRSLHQFGAVSQGKAGVASELLIKAGPASILQSHPVAIFPVAY